MTAVNCPRCKTPNDATARFCQSCGSTLGGTITGGTIVAPSNPSPSGTRLGPLVYPPGVVPGPFTPRSSQREHLFVGCDISGSMAEICDENVTKIDAAGRAIRNMVLRKARIDPQDAVGLVTFTDTARVVVPLGPILANKQLIVDAAQSLAADGGTDIEKCLKCIEREFDWHLNDVVRRIILATDGHGGDPLAVAQELKSRGVIIDVIGIGDHPSNVDEQLLRAVASTIHNEVHYRFIRDHRTLIDHVTNLGDKTLTA